MRWYRKKEKKAYSYHSHFEDKVFFNSIKLILQRDFSHQDLTILLSLVAVVAFRGDMEKFENFLSQRAEDFKTLEKKI